MTDDIDAAIDAAVEQARATYHDEDHHPLDHGYAAIVDVDGRTRFARAAQDHPDLTVSTGGVQGTEVTIDGVNRYLNAQAAALRAFVDALDEHGVDVDGRVFTHGH